MAKAKTKAQLEDEIQKLKNESDYYRYLAIDHANEIDSLTKGENVIARKDFDKLRGEYDYLQNQIKTIIETHKKELSRERKRYNELLKTYETQGEELEQFRSMSGWKHNERGAGRKAKLTPEVIRLVKSYRLEGATYAKIAEIMGLALGTVHKAANSGDTQRVIRYVAAGERYWYVQLLYRKAQAVWNEETEISLEYKRNRHDIYGTDGNYFHTEDAAQKFVDAIDRLLDSHREVCWSEVFWSVDISTGKAVSRLYHKGGGEPMLSSYGEALRYPPNAFYSETEAQNVADVINQMLQDNLYCLCN